jgi:multidrug transporter EmrE-like cation transporter
MKIGFNDKRIFTIKEIRIYSKQISILLVIGCSFLGTLAQFSFKVASNHAVINNWGKIFINPYLIIGYILYGISMVLLTIALKKGELSFLYPFIALTFIWVTIFSPIIFQSDHFMIMRFVGVIAIVIGVSFIGFGSKNEN